MTREQAKEIIARAKANLGSVPREQVLKAIQVLAAIGGPS